MVQETHVLRLTRAEQERLEERLRQEPFEVRSVPHARFSVKGDGVVATLYLSGKLVVQGAQGDLFCARFLDRLPESETAASQELGEPPPGGFRIGSDEVGKGDYFGPLIVVALRAGEAERKTLRELGVADSKKVSDGRVRKMAPYLAEHFEHRIEALDPPQYNTRYARAKSLNPLLADLHAAAIGALACEGDEVLVDQFAAKRLLEERTRGMGITLMQAHRAERDVAVAAASLIARGRFLEALDELSERFGVLLRKGAGEPTDRAAREFVRLHGREALASVAKLHFRNTDKVSG